MLKKRLLAISLGLLVVAGLAAGGLWYSYQRFLETPLNVAEARTLDVKKGLYFNALAKKLEQEYLISSARYLRLLGRLEPELTRIRAGEYQLIPGQTPRELLTRLAAGDTIKYHFTIVEGTTFSEVRSALAKETALESRVPQLSDADLVQALALDAASPEGLFLAETYQFERGTTDLELLGRAHQHLQQVLDDAWAARDPDLPLQSPYQALILASIVEKETGLESERPTIAGVFVRRLSKGMRLQTDPTVIYGMGERYKGNITRRDLQTPTPYNTYQIDGLPPTPIALVGPDAIRAALNPAPGKALYFVAKGDGSHHFSATLAEHNAAVSRYQLTRRENYRSSPEP